MKKILGAVALSCSLSMISIQPALASEWGCGEGLSKIVSSLKVDNTQKEKIKPILDDLKTTMKDIQTKMGDVEKQINTQMSSNPMDESAVDNLLDQKTKLIGDAMKAKFKAKSQISTVLTPEQKTQLQSMTKALEDKIQAKVKNCYGNE